MLNILGFICAIACFNLNITNFDICKVIEISKAAKNRFENVHNVSFIHQVDTRWQHYKYYI